MNFSFYCLLFYNCHIIPFIIILDPPKFEIVNGKLKDKNTNLCLKRKDDIHNFKNCGSGS